MKILAVLWAFACFFYGTFLFIKKFFIKERTVLFIQSINCKWYGILLAVLSFFYIPFIFQKTCFNLLPQALPKVDKVLWLAFGGELCLLCLLIFFFYRYKHFWTNIQTSCWTIKPTLKQIFDGFCQCLPLMLAVMLFWNGLLTLLIQIGIPISLESQFIIQFLGKYNPQLSSLVALGICVTIFAPFCEEVLFRGIGIKFLAKFFSPQKALWISSFIFAIAHQHFPTLLPLIILGYRLGIIYVKTNNLWVNIGIHSLFNATNFALILIFK